MVRAGSCLGAAQPQLQPIEERLYLFLRVVYYELGELDQVVSLLQELIRRYPRPTLFSLIHR